MSLRERLVQDMRLTANASASYTGYGTTSDRLVIDRCRRIFSTPALLHVLIFTRDEGMHSSGWWKNPDYERCWHLSVSFRDRESGELAPHDKLEAKRWCELFYPTTTHLIWAEPPFSNEGKTHDTWHYRVFVAEDWTTPILPRGEVYTNEFTELGWKTWSEVHGHPWEGSAAAAEHHGRHT